MVWMMRILLAVFLAASPAFGQDPAAPDPKAVSELLKDIEGPDASVRKNAFEKLNAVKDPQVSARLKKTLQGAAAQAFRKSVAERTRALRALMAASRKGFNPQAFAARQKEVLGILAAGDTKKMEPLVRGMWKDFYFDPTQADSDEKAAEAAARVKETEEFMKAAGAEEKEGPSSKLKEAFRSLDESHLILLLSPKDQKVMNGNSAVRDKVGAEEYRLVFVTNQYRILVGKTPLKLNLKLCAAAREHSRDMIENKFFAHESPLPGKRTPGDRAARHGASASGENIAMGNREADPTFWQWFGSLGHHRNMLGDYTEIGVGNHEAHWTEMFA
jgi:uncharacterized protein YkwD